MICTNCKKEIYDDSSYCPYCGMNIGTGTKRKRLIHPKTNISRYKVASLIFSTAVLVLSFLSWLGAEGYVFHAYELFQASSDVVGQQALTIYSLVVTILQGIILASSLLYVGYEFAVKGTPENPIHIKISKIGTTVSIICAAIILAYTIYMGQTGYSELSLKAPFYFSALFLCINRYLVVPEYLDGYYQNRRMDALDVKYNGWMLN
ncbi:MAG: zinc ribbon domain-containing protein [Clostridia bacterium]|nr:zinc ribbon domain-containing protein [Clostridia bacterium]